MGMADKVGVREEWRKIVAKEMQGNGESGNSYKVI